MDLDAHDPDPLLRYEGFVRKLAQAVVEDAATADDIVQDAMLLAWLVPPRELGSQGSTRAWFRTVVRRLVGRERRLRSAREARERRAAARESAVPSAAEVLAAEDQRRHLVQQLLALPEKHRELLLLRYFDGLNASQIGRKLARPAGTIRQQLRRALVALRARLDRDDGGGQRDWALALIPVALPPTGTRAGARLGSNSALASTGATLLFGGWMTNKLLLFAGAVSMLLGLLLIYRANSAEALPPGSNTSTSSVQGAPSSEKQPLDKQPLEAPQRQPATPSPPRPGAASDLIVLRANGQPATDLAYGFVIDALPPSPAGWAGMTGVQLQRQSPSAPRSDEQGRVSLEEHTAAELLWIRIREGQFALFALEESEELTSCRSLVLPRDVPHRILVRGIEADERWRASFEPAWRDPEGLDEGWNVGDIFHRLPPRTGHACALLLCVRALEGKGPAPRELLAPAGQPALLHAWVDRRELLEGQVRHEARAGPADWSFVAGPLLPRLSVEFVDSVGQRLPPQSGTWTVLEENQQVHHHTFSKQNPVELAFQSFRDGQSYAVRVVTRQGDLHTWQLHMDASRSDRCLRLVREAAEDTQRLRIPPEMTSGSELTLVADYGDERSDWAVDLMNRPLPQRSARPEPHELHFWDRRPAFVLDSDSLTFFPAKGRELQRLWLNDERGRVAKLRAGETSFRRIPTARELELDLRSLMRERGIPEASYVTVMFELRPQLEIAVQGRELRRDWPSSLDSVRVQLPEGVQAWLMLNSRNRELRLPLTPR